jgi:hypothetical protein
MKGNHNSASSLKMKAIDASIAAKNRALLEVTDIDKQSKLLLRPHREETNDMKSEFTL